MNHLKTELLLFATVVVFTVALSIVPSGFIDPELGNTLLTITTFLFGIIAGFYIVVTTTDYNTLKTTLASETAVFIALYQNIRIYHPPSAEKISAAIDAYIRRTFDYEIIDYTSATDAEFNAVMQTANELPGEGANPSVIEEVRALVSSLLSYRQQLIVLGTKALSMFQWWVLIVLAFLFIAALYSVRTGGAFYDAVTVAIASSVILILLMIRDLDLYTWNEQKFRFDIFQNVLRSLGHLPYYPLELIKRGRVEPAETEYRLGIYTNYPKSLNRKVEVRKA